MLARADIETDNGPREGRRGTERLCALTREVKPIDELIRFVAAPDGAIVPDLKRRLPARAQRETAVRRIELQITDEHRRKRIEGEVHQGKDQRRFQRDAEEASAKERRNRRPPHGGRDVGRKRA